MNSLQDLNNATSTPIEVTDQRLATVLFDRTVTFDQTFTASTVTVNTVPAVEITEVINYSTANVRYRATITSNSSTFISGSSLTFASLPTGVTSATTSTSTTKTYTLTGLKSDLDWQVLRAPVWTLPAAYATFAQWFIRFEIIYYDESISADRTRTWDFYDPDYYPVSEQVSQASLTVAAGVIYDYSADLNTSFDLETDGPFKSFRADLNSSFTQSSSVIRFKGIIEDLPSTSTCTVAGRRLRLASTTMSVSSSLSAVIGKRIFFNSLMYVVAGPIGPGSVPYLEGNGFPFQTGLGSWPQGFPGIVRIKDGGAVTMNMGSSQLTIGDDARLMSAMIMSSGTLSADVIRLKGILDNLPSEFNLSLPDGGNIEGGRSLQQSTANLSVQDNYIFNGNIAMPAIVNTNIIGRYSGIVSGITARSYADIKTYGNSIYAIEASALTSDNGLWVWNGSGDFTQVVQTSGIPFDNFAINQNNGNIYATAAEDLYFLSAGGSSFTKIIDNLSNLRGIAFNGNDLYVTTNTAMYKLVDNSLELVIEFPVDGSPRLTFYNGYVYILQNRSVLKNITQNTFTDYDDNYQFVYSADFNEDGSLGIPESILANDQGVFLAFTNDALEENYNSGISGRVWTMIDSNSPNGSSIDFNISPSAKRWSGLAMTANQDLYAMTLDGELYISIYTN